MLVIDEYKELEFLESVLRRLGFDILSLSKDISVASAILGFFPDIVIAQGKSRAVDGVALGPKIKKTAANAKIVLLHPPGQLPKLTPEAKRTVDGFLESPVDTAKLISMLSSMGNMDESVLQEKLNRIAAGQAVSEQRRVKGGGGQGQSEMVHIQGKLVKPHVPSGQPSGSNEDGGMFTTGVHHIQGDNKLKGSAHIHGESEGSKGAAYNPAGSQTSSKGGAAYIPSQREGVIGTRSTNGTYGNFGSTTNTERSKKYDEFLAAKNDDVSNVIPAAELRKRAKEYKLANSTETELNAKREFVKALFRK